MHTQYNWAQDAVSTGRNRPTAAVGRGSSQQIGIENFIRRRDSPPLHHSDDEDEDMSRERQITRN